MPRPSRRPGRWLPLPRAEPASDTATVRYTCEPWADARTNDPANPNLITNKDCPEMIAAKERAQREFRDKMDREAVARNDEEVGDWRERACNDPSDPVYGTETCGIGLDLPDEGDSGGTSG